MKAKIRKTGEIIDVISYSCNTKRESTDCVSYIDSKGMEHPSEKLNYYWDLEKIDIPDIDWEQRRYEIAKSVYAATNHISAKDAVWDADLLIKELKK